MNLLIRKLGKMVDLIVQQSWFFALFMFLGFVITGSVKNKEDLIEKLVLCLVFWLLDFLFLKKYMTKFLKSLAEKNKSKAE
ncbi:MAG: hypothetical protein DI598_12670 [Pseudopedobacter saltans]|uniref:Uncharacterized protein n=1 Tax=Pseudopedobacter saltans TaxID=151895 RepID=A0A2W5GRU8_9SPHI|nr:MAG: hypothetical protein DI598_12670 [Pseudopedobacter saltans]